MHKIRSRTQIFFLTLLSTVGFAVFFSTLLIYATRELKLPTSTALGLIGAFNALNFILHLIGGYVGGRWVSNRTLLLLGLIFQTTGSFLVSLGTTGSLYSGISVFLVGSGISVTPINAFITQLYSANDPERESAFLWNYSGMNLGFLLGFFLSGFFDIGQHYGILFKVSGSISILGMLILFFTWPLIREKSPLYTERSPQKHTSGFFTCLIFLFAMIIFIWWLQSHIEICNFTVLGVTAFFIILMFFLAMFRPNKRERSQFLAFNILLICSITFWILYQMAPSGLMLFNIHNINRTVGGFTIPPQWFMNINSIVIIVCGPLLALFFKYLRNKNINVTIPGQFAGALLLCSTGYFILPIGIEFASAKGFSPMTPFVVSNILQALGELCISPIGYAMVGKLVPAQFQGLMMGCWLMTTGVSATIASTISKHVIPTGELSNPLKTNPSFLKLFLYLGGLSCVCALILFCLYRVLNKLIEKPPIEKEIPHPFNSPEDI